MSKSHSRTFATNFQQLINYAHSFGDHNMTLLFGHENSTSTDEGVSATRSGMFSYFDNQELSGAIKVQDGSSNQSKYNTEGYFFRGMYDYDGKYFAQASYRCDASSNFAPGHRWGSFYSFGGAWILTKEKWMESSKGWLDMLKVKASFGQQGNVVSAATSTATSMWCATIMARWLLLSVPRVILTSLGRPIPMSMQVWSSVCSIIA